ncbi:hypothetical protein NHJ6243_006749 [Beauveria neobassiana]
MRKFDVALIAAVRSGLGEFKARVHVLAGGSMIGRAVLGGHSRTAQWLEKLSAKVSSHRAAAALTSRGGNLEAHQPIVFGVPV